MCLLGWTKVVLDTQMNLHSTGLEPTSSSQGEMSRLWHMRNAEQAFVEVDRSLLCARRHRELDMLDSVNDHPLRLLALALSCNRFSWWSVCREGSTVSGLPG